MKRFLKSGLVAAAAVGLMAGVASAGTLGANTKTVALEALGANRDVALNGSIATLVGTGVNAGVNFTLGQNLSTGNLLKVDWGTGLAFVAGAYSICAENEGATNAAIAEATPGAGSDSQYFQVGDISTMGANVEAGNVVWLVQGSTAANCNNAPLVRVLASGASTGQKNITVGGYTSGATLIDSASSAVAINVANEFTASVTTRELVIDYLGGSSNAGNLFTAASTNITDTAANATALNLAQTAMDFDTVTDAGLAVNVALLFAADTDWTGASNLWIGGAGADAAGNCNNIQSSSGVPSGAVSLTANAPAFAGTASNNLAVCIEVDGTTSLAARTVSGQYDINIGGTGGVDHDPVDVTWQTWSSNGWSGRVPHMRHSGVARTFVRIVNANTTGATVMVDVVTPDGTALDRVTLGSIAAGETKTYSAEDIATEANTSVGDFDATFTVTANPSNVYANAFFNLQSGGTWTTRDTTLYEVQDYTVTNGKMK